MGHRLQIRHLLSSQSLTFVMFLHLNSESRWATQNGVRMLNRYLRGVYVLRNVFLTKISWSYSQVWAKKKNKIDNIKFIINLVTELKSSLKRYPKRKLFLKAVA